MLKSNKVKKVAATALSVACCAAMFVVPASAADVDTTNLSDTLVNSLSSVNYNVILEVVVSLVPVIFPALFGCMAVRKGISFALGMFRGA